MAVELRTASPEPRKPRPGAGRKTSPNPFTPAMLAEVVGKPGVAREFDVELSEDQPARLAKAYFERERTKAAKVWAMSNTPRSYVAGTWPTLALRFTQKAGSTWTVKFWHAGNGTAYTQR